MYRWLIAYLGAAGAALLAAGPAVAGQSVYEYRVEHPTYGDIGTYTNVIDQQDGRTVVHSELHVAVSILGITMFRQDAVRTEHWQNDRMVSFRSVTTTDGEDRVVSGEARPEGFVITANGKTIVAPPDVYPSNPWTAKMLGRDTGVTMSTRTGELDKVRIRDAGYQTPKVGGSQERLRQYEIVGNKKQVVWFNDRGDPVAFNTNEKGTLISFELKRPELAGSSTAPAREARLSGR